MPFPSNPTPGQTHTEDNTTWVYAGPVNGWYRQTVNPGNSTSYTAGLITSDKIVNNTIVNADVNASAAIAGTKISPNFGSQTVQTTGVFSHALGTAAAPAISVTGDPNTGIYSPGADQLAISTNGTGRLFVDASGNLTVDSSANATGIFNVRRGGAADQTIHFENKTTSSGVDYNVAKTLKLNLVHGGKNGGFDAGWQLNSGCGSGIATNNGFFALNKLTNQDGSTSNEVLRITSAGLVGVGTSVPVKLLDVYGDAGLIVRSTNRNTTETPVFIGGGDNNQRKFAIIGKPAGSYGRQDLLFCSNNVEDSADVTSANAVVTIKSDGKVGIGTTSPTNPLHVLAPPIFQGVSALFAMENDHILRISRAAPATSPGNLDFLVGANGTGTVAADADLRIQDGGGGWVTIFRHGSSTERLRIDPAGRLLVGTSSDSGGALFQVNGDRIRVGTAKTPASATATGTTGEICWDANYIYVCTATNTWKRTAIATW